MLKLMLRYPAPSTRGLPQHMHVYSPFACHPPDNVISGYISESINLLNKSTPAQDACNRKNPIAWFGETDAFYAAPYDRCTEELCTLCSSAGQTPYMYMCSGRDCVSG